MVETELQFSVPMVVTLGLAYATVLVLSLVGNFVVLIIVIRNSQMRSMIDLFICNLSTADILAAMMVLPLTFFQNIWKSWHFGQAMCKTFPYLQGVTVGASIMTLTVVAFDRYMAICYPLKRLITRRDAKWIILAIWVFACATLSPWAITYTEVWMTHNETLPNSSIVINITRIGCYDEWASSQIYFIAWIVFGLYVVPLLLITSFYAAIACRIWDRIRGPSDSNASAAKSSQYSGGANVGGRGPALRTDGGLNKKKTMKIVKMLVVVVVLFGVSRLPFYVYIILEMFLHISERFAYFAYVLAWLQWLVASNCCVNPWVYCLYSKKYRAGFRNVLMCMGGRMFAMDNEASRQARSTITAGGGNATVTYSALPLGARRQEQEAKTASPQLGRYHGNHAANRDSRTDASAQRSLLIGSDQKESTNSDM